MYLLVKTICYVCIDMLQYLQEVLWSKQYMCALCSDMVPMLCACLVFILLVYLGRICTPCRGVHIALLLSVTQSEGYNATITMATAPDSTPCTVHRVSLLYLECACMQV